jgi:hypothetical protein
MVIGFVSGICIGLGMIFASRSTAACEGPEDTAFTRDTAGLFGTVLDGGTPCDASGPGPPPLAVAVGIFRLFGGLAVAERPAFAMTLTSSPAEARS